MRFDHLFDRLTIRFFAHKLGVDAKTLRARPYATYVAAMAGAIAESEHVEQCCLFGVDSRLDEQGREVHRDPTVCAVATRWSGSTNTASGAAAGPSFCRTTGGWI